MNLRPYIVDINDWTPPDWFKNFQSSLSLTKSQVPYLIHINNELKKYNARLVTNNIDYYDTQIQFNSEADYTYFLLKWS